MNDQSEPKDAAIDAFIHRWQDARALERDGYEVERVAHFLKQPDRAVPEEVRAFHRELCEIRILDPACGSAITRIQGLTSNGQGLRYPLISATVGSSAHA